MNAGVPVLVSNCTSIERIVNETQAGLIYIYNSPQDLAQKIIGLISAPEILSTMGANGRKAVLEKYNWRHSSQELIRMYSVFDQN
jgi:glycosyltransferase involved in cell wall biosynthesis